MKSVELLDLDYLSHALREAFPHLPFDLEILSTIDSTNRYLLEKKTKNLQICLAEEQTAGRGRLGKTWASPFGVNLYCSIAWPFKKNILELPHLSLCIGTVVSQTLEDYGVSQIGLKWPNDVLCQNKKIAGILVETKSDSNIVIGIGINVFLSTILDIGDQIDQPWIDVKSVVTFEPNRNQLASLLLTKLLTALPLFEQSGFTPFQKTWLKKDLLLNQSITLKIGENVLTGIAKGIDETGRLLLETEGKIKHFSSAEVHHFRSAGDTYP